MKLVGALLAATLTSTASAGIVTEWGYNNQAGFLLWTGKGEPVGPLTASGDSSTGSTNIIDNNLLSDGIPDGIIDAFDSALPTHLAWGTPYVPKNPGGLQSSLDVDSAVLGAPGSLITDGDFVNGTSITHNNFIINSDSDSLQTAFALDALTLTPSAWIGGEMVASVNYAPQLAFGIAFHETPNNQAMCANGEANGVGDNLTAGGDSACGDIFEITGLSDLGLVPVLGPNYIEFTVPFYLTTGDSAWDQHVYYITTRLSGLTILPESFPCTEDAALTCFGFVTKEDQSNVLQAQFKIRVPEPTTIALFGLALIATGFASRKKNRL